ATTRTEPITTSRSEAVVLERAQFDRSAWFAGAQFGGNAWFDKTHFNAEADFSSAQFNGDVWFDQAQFGTRTFFDQVQFDGNARFDGARFSGDAWFAKAQFNRVSEIGPIVCLGRLDLSGAYFALPLTIEVAGRELLCARTRWESTALLRVRYAKVDLTDAVLSSPLAVNSHPAVFKSDGQTMNEHPLSDRPATAGVTSVSGIDAAHLVLTDTDLSECQFAGAFHLDQIRLEGRTDFAPVPTGLLRRQHPWPDRWSQRRTLAEEHHWRAQNASQPAHILGQPPQVSLWRPGPHHDDPDRTPDPVDVAAAYRQLRKAFEDGKNEPGAADFYYGEMEMRRHDKTSTPRAERGLLHGYWLLSGYGLRASRALVWLAVAMLTTILLLMVFGLPQHSPTQQATGTVPAGGGRVTFTLDKDDPQNPTADRLTSKRFERTLNVTLNSVVFRSSGQDLTTAGTYIEMASRLIEPALLALAVLAIRGRIKR
ncbi:pentapeptide repeat-containing protein, partial [Streptomyces sp. ADMS]|uniref:pentapeptide repeat-containing protein n=1 Tax=Streptomyces sp. ADMS TaxID=3071415 RepID=UPI00296FF7E8